MGCPLLGCPAEADILPQGREFRVLTHKRTLGLMGWRWADPLI
jgi:hypothetical protein